MSLAQRTSLKLLASDRGAKFDKRFADTFAVAAHEDAVRLFEKEVRNGKDADVKAFAEKTLPTLRHHLKP